MVTKRAVVQNKNGIHVRPSKEISQAAAGYKGSVQIETATQAIHDTNTISLISLGLVQGDVVYITVEGPNEEQFCSHLASLFAKQFDYPPRGTNSKEDTG
ncbi:MAG: HPr family phosphocarrier protein [Spirochaetota bacterium]